VICYIDAGTWEDWRPDASQFPASVKGKADAGWAGERWLDIRRLSTLAPLLRARIAMCKQKSFDAVDFDNVDGYQNDTGFPLTAAQQLTFDRFLANAAHDQGLSVALKNDLAQIPQLVRNFDFAVNESCFDYDECAAERAFIRAGKAVFVIEYDLATTSFCTSARAEHFGAIRKHLNLNAWRQAC
jgi:hypothetical protein